MRLSLAAPFSAALYATGATSQKTENKTNHKNKLTPFCH